MSSSTTRRSPFHGSSRRRRTIALFFSEDMLLLSSALVPARRRCAPRAGTEAARKRASGHEVKTRRSSGASGVGNRLLAAATYATGDQALHEQGARTVET